MKFIPPLKRRSMCPHQLARNTMWLLSCVAVTCMLLHTSPGGSGAHCFPDLVRNGLLRLVCLDVHQFIFVVIHHLRARKRSTGRQRGADADTAA